jgi:hypothetical protein
MCDGLEQTIRITPVIIPEEMDMAQQLVKCNNVPRIMHGILTHTTR